MKDFPFKTVLRQSHVTHQNMKSRYIYSKNFKTNLQFFYMHVPKQTMLFLYINKTKFTSQATLEKSEIEILIR